MATKSKNTTITLMIILIIITLFIFGLQLALWVGISPLDFISADSDIERTNATTVFFEKTEYDILNTRYKSDVNEFVYCLYGETNSEGYFITKIQETKVLSSTEGTISYKPCSRDKIYLGTLHSHPIPNSRNYVATCKLSKQDLFTFGSDDSVMVGVICGENKIAFYGKNNFDESFTIKQI